VRRVHGGHVQGQRWFRRLYSVFRELEVSNFQYSPDRLRVQRGLHGPRRRAVHGVPGIDVQGRQRLRRVHRLRGELWARALCADARRRVQVQRGVHRIRRGAMLGVSRVNVQDRSRLCQLFCMPAELSLPDW
jgi:hypothetical protein